MWGWPLNTPVSLMNISGNDPEPKPKRGFEAIFFKALDHISILVMWFWPTEIQLAFGTIILKKLDQKIFTYQLMI